MYILLMDKELYEKLHWITREEQAILDGSEDIEASLYTSDKETGKPFVVDSTHLLEKGRQVDVRPHTRFVHFPRHTHNYVEMVYMYSGTTTHIINDTETLVLKEGDLLFLNQNVTQEIMPAGVDDIAINFIILPAFFERSMTMLEQDNIIQNFLISSLSPDNDHSDYLYFSAKDILPVRNLLENMIWTIFKRNTHTNTLNQTTMGLIFMNLSAFATNVNEGRKSDYEQNLIFTLLRYIETNYKDGTLSDISASLKQPTYAMSRLLKKYTGKNFKELLQERKLEQAAYLLSETTMTIEAIMSAIGYDNSSYFYRVFEERNSVSPKTYRKNALLARQKP